MNNIKKLLFLCLVGLFLFVATELCSHYGNPITQLRIQWDAEQHMEQYHNDLDWDISSISYSPVDERYFVYIYSPTSVDTQFYLTYESARMIADSYEALVLSGHTTHERISRVYNQLVCSVIPAELVPNTKLYISASLCSDYYIDTLDVSGVEGIDPSTLVRDAEYDVKALGAKHGEIVIYADCADATSTQMLAIMRAVAVELDQAGVPFALITITIRSNDTTAVMQPITRDALISDNALQIIQDNLTNA